MTPTEFQKLHENRETRQGDGALAAIVWALALCAPVVATFVLTLV